MPTRAAKFIGRSGDAALKRHGCIVPVAAVSGSKTAVVEPDLVAVPCGTRRILHLRDGQIAALFLILYGMFRFVVEFSREPDPQLGFIAFGWLTMGQLLSIVISAAGLVHFAVRAPQHAEERAAKS